MKGISTQMPQNLKFKDSKIQGFKAFVSAKALTC
jgi:hypothetical protein